MSYTKSICAPFIPYESLLTVTDTDSVSRTECVVVTNYSDDFK